MAVSAQRVVQQRTPPIATKLLGEGMPKPVPKMRKRPLRGKLVAESDWMCG
jgi:hypothetical protein